MELRYWLLLIVLGAIWGSAFIFIKIATPELGSVFLVSLRLAIASLIFLPILLQHKYRKQFRNAFPHILFLAIFNNAIPFVMFSEASYGSDSSMLAILNSSTALLTLTIAFFWIDERFSKLQLFGLFVGFLGIIILVNPANSSTTLLSSFYALLGASCYALCGVFIQKYSQNINKFVLIGWSLAFGSLVLIPIALFNIPEVFPSKSTILSVLWLGGISTGLAFIGYVRLIEKIGAVRTSTVAYLLPVFGIIWGYIFLGESITLNIVIGCIMVLVGIFFATNKKSDSLGGDHGT